MDIAAIQKKLKAEEYWDELSSGPTSFYKKLVVEKLLREHFDSVPSSRVLDVGCGGSSVAFAFRELLQPREMVCIDYDAKLIEEAKAASSETLVRWREASVYDLADWEERFELVFLFDILHEVYSFDGRIDADLEQPISHEKGIASLRRALESVDSVLCNRGGMVVTDNVLCEEQIPVCARCQSPEVHEAVRKLLTEYPSRILKAELSSDGVLEIDSQDFCVLLTQYNKIKKGDWARWKIERLETHQYMTPSEYHSVFDTLGYSVFFELGSPEAAYNEWKEDFSLISGWKDFSPKRISLLAIKKG